MISNILVAVMAVLATLCGIYCIWNENGNTEKKNDKSEAKSNEKEKEHE